MESTVFRESFCEQEVSKNFGKFTAGLSTIDIFKVASIINKGIQSNSNYAMLSKNFLKVVFSLPNLT